MKKFNFFIVGVLAGLIARLAVAKFVKLPVFYEDGWYEKEDMKDWTDD